MRIALALFFIAGCAAHRPVTHGVEVRTMSFAFANAHLVIQGESAFLVDSGYQKNVARLDEAIREQGIDPSKLRAVVLTHGHADHAGAAHLFRAKYGIPVVVGLGDEAMYRSGKNEPLCPTGVIGVVRRQFDQDASYEGSRADIVVVNELDLTALTGVEAKVTRVGGHTTGSLVVTAGDVALVGDLFRGPLIGSGVEEHFFQCDLEATHQARDAVLNDIAPNAQVFFTGHFGPVRREHIPSPAGEGQGEGQNR